MAEKKELEHDASVQSDDGPQVGADALSLSTDDPVYDANARVLNRAASVEAGLLFYLMETDVYTDSRHWHGLVPMAAFHCYWIWMGQRQLMAHCHLPYLYSHSE